MDSDLLTKEKEFIKLNDDLKMKTRNLLKVMENNVDKEIENSKDESRETHEHNLLASYGRRNVGSEGLIRVLQGKVKLLSDQLSNLQSDYVKRTNEYKSLQEEVVKAEEGTLKNKQSLLTSHDKLKKQEKLVSTITSHLQIRDRENNILKKQVEDLKRELAQHESSSKGNEVRLNRSLEEIERLKETLKKAQQEEKRLKDLNKAIQDDFNKTITRLEKQKSEIVSLFKKQMCLISNLKKQLGTLETSKLINIAEDEFTKILDWAPGLV